MQYHRADSDIREPVPTSPLYASISADEPTHRFESGSTRPTPIQQLEITMETPAQESEEDYLGRSVRSTGTPRTVVCVFLSLLIILVICDASTTRYLESWTVQLLQWVMDHPWWGSIAIIVVYIIASILFVPASILTIGTGYAFHTQGNVVPGLIWASTVSMHEVLRPASLG
jgi:hypothetical protein